MYPNDADELNDVWNQHLSQCASKHCNKSLYICGADRTVLSSLNYEPRELQAIWLQGAEPTAAENQMFFAELNTAQSLSSHISRLLYERENTLSQVFLKLRKMVRHFVSCEIYLSLGSQLDPHQCNPTCAVGEATDLCV